MKRTMVYILAMTMLFTTLLSGCGENMQNRKETADKASPSPMPTEIVPDEMMPETEDGVVDDTDGIITEHETGNRTGILPDAGTDTSGDTSSGAGTGAGTAGGAGTGTGIGTGAGTDSGAGTGTIKGSGASADQSRQ